ncbi:MAG: OmpA family protein [Betaproteobacteria bacterium]|nr:OmpA family protein [Betaproteobacteria bacterium]
MLKENSKATYPELERRSRRAERDHSEHRWLVSYSDFITLLFAFFVVMYGISAVNDTKYKRFHSAINSAFKGNNDGTPGVLQIEQDQVIKSLIDQRNARWIEEQRQQQEAVQSMVGQLSHVLMPLVQKGLVRVWRSARGVVIDLNAKVLFPEGEAELQSNAHQPLDEVAAVLRSSTLAVEVMGYTDNIPISTPRYPSNWELSTARASRVARLFVEDGVSGSRLTAAGVADNDPLVPNDSPENRARNRRVTITIVTPSLIAKPESRQFWDH